MVFVVRLERIDFAPEWRVDGAGRFPRTIRLGWAGSKSRPAGTCSSQSSSSGEGFWESHWCGDQGQGAFRRSTGFDHAVWAEQAGSCYSGAPLRDRIDGDA